MYSLGGMGVESNLSSKGPMPPGAYSKGHYFPLTPGPESHPVPGPCLHCGISFPGSWGQPPCPGVPTVRTLTAR